MVVLKTLFKWIVLPIVTLLIIISLGLVVTGNAYIFRGLQLIYFHFVKQPLRHITNLRG